MKWYELKFFIDVFYLTLCMIWELFLANHMPFAAQARHFFYIFQALGRFLAPQITLEDHIFDLIQIWSKWELFFLLFICIFSTKFCNYGSYFSLIHMPFALHSMFHVELRLRLHGIGHVQIRLGSDPLCIHSTGSKMERYGST